MTTFRDIAAGAVFVLCTSDTHEPYGSPMIKLSARKAIGAGGRHYTFAASTNVEPVR